MSVISGNSWEIGLPWLQPISPCLCFQGIVPSDVHILPGQLKDVHEAIGEVRNKPPPLPDPNIRPPISHSRSAGDILSPDHLGGYPSSHMGQTMQFGAEDSDDSGSFTSHLTKPGRSASVPGEMGNGSAVQNLRQLRQRQNNIASQELNHHSDSHGEPTPPSKIFHATMPGNKSSGSVPPQVSTAHHTISRLESNDSNFSFGSPLPRGENGGTMNPLFSWEEKNEPEPEPVRSGLMGRRMSNPQHNGTMPFNHLGTTGSVGTRY